MQRQRHVAMLTGGHPSALPTLYQRCEAAAVLEEDDLFAMLQCLAYLI